MNSTRSQKWLLFSFFLVIGLIFIYFIFFITYNWTDKTYTTMLESARVGPGSYQHGNWINLVKDQSLRVGKIQMTYRGRTADTILIDLVLLELDPSYVYAHQIPLKEAKQGFRMSDTRFMATSISDKRLRLVMAS